jgi:phenylacetate-CoA ligase
MIVKFKKLYSKSPDFVKQLVRLIPFRYRMGKVFRETLRFLEESDRWSTEQYKAYQERRLAKLLRLAIGHVPYFTRYRKLLSKSPFEILSEIEPVTKRQIQQNLDQFLLPEDMRGKCHVTYTGGSSGFPLKMYLNDDAAEIEWAFMIVQWMRVGYRPGDRRAAFRGVEFKESRKTSVLMNPVYDEVMFSPFDLSDHALSDYVETIRKWRPKCLRGYPSALTVLARYIDQNGIEDLPEIRTLFCGSEGFTDEQREYLERVFKTRFYSWYGMTEKAVLAGECEESSAYHCFPQYGIVEIRDSDGNVSSDIGTEGEILGTGFLNRVMPFIRYRLEDYASIIGDRCAKCGRNHTLLSKISGRYRVQDVIVGKSGSRIPLTAINMHDDTFATVRQFQFDQNKQGKVTLFLKVGRSFNDENRNLIMKSLSRKTGDDIDYDIQLVDRIEGTDIGKGVYLRQRIKNPTYPM